MAQPNQTTTRPDHVQLVELYGSLTLIAGRDRSTIDSTQIAFDDITMTMALEQQGVAAADVPEALEKLIGWGMIQKRMPPVSEQPLDIMAGEKPIYSFTHKAAALYHGMQLD
jgi:hypothetical protein